MIELAPNLILILLACWGAGWLAFLGGHGTDGPGDSLIRAGYQGLCGLGLLSVVGGIVNIFFPLSTLSYWVIPVLAVLALAGLRWQSKGLWGLEILLIFILTVVFSSRTVLHGDTGNYHQQAILWMAQDALPRGLANLHGRFGFNSSWWIDGAWMELPWIPVGAAIYFPIGVLVFFFGLIFVGSLRKMGVAKASEIVILAAGYLWFRQLAGINNPSFSTDAPTNLLIVASAAALVRWATSETRPQVWLRVWCLLAATAATFKLTALPWFGFSFLAVCYFAIKLKSTKRIAEIFGALWLPFAVGLAFIGVYAFRGMIISGYPFYPTRLLAIWDLPWSVPSDTLTGDTEGIRNWPTRGEAQGPLEFVWRWIENQFGLTNIIFGTVLLAGLFAVVIFVMRKRGIQHFWDALRPLMPILLASLIAFSVCFIYAPALRFVSGTFFVTAGIVAACVWDRSDWLRKKYLVPLLAAGFLAAAVLPNIPGALRRPISMVRLPKLPVPEVHEETTLQGERIWINTDGGSWAVPPPATPYFNEKLIIVRDSASGRIREMRAGREK